jgi:phage terminase Nu1 subunit (DNA packaging protein)
MATVDVKQLAEMMNVTPRRVQQMAATEGLPKAGKGRYDAGKCLLWYIRYLQAALEKKSVPVGDGKYSSMGDEKARSIRADAELKEMELAHKRKELVRVADVAKTITDIVTMTKARIMALPPRIAADTTGEQSRTMVQAKVEKALVDALNHLADDGRSYSPHGAH